MKTLQEHKKDFLKKAREYDMGKTDEDFHSYMRQNNLEHHLSETQIQDRNRENNSLNGLGLVAGIAIPLTFGAIFGANKIMKEINNMGMGGTYLPYGEEDNNLRYGANLIIPDNSALSGTNTRPMPRADAHIGQNIQTILNYPTELINEVNRNMEEIENERVGLEYPNVPPSYNFAGMTNTGKSKARSSTIRSNIMMDRAQMIMEDRDVV